MVPPEAPKCLVSTAVVNFTLPQKVIRIINSWLCISYGAVIQSTVGFVQETDLNLTDIRYMLV